jgi:signal-transduction protein with cAMP-binding, CBS, and nucleotidyltransferase domain
MMLDPEGEAVEALQRMIRSGEGRLPVVKDGKAVGMITRKDILNLLEIKTDLMGESLIKSPIPSYFTFRFPNSSVEF